MAYFIVDEIFDQDPGGFDQRVEEYGQADMLDKAANGPTLGYKSRKFRLWSMIIQSGR